MSEENKQEVAPEANANNDKDLMATIEQLKSTNERLLQESKSYKTRKSEVEEIKAQLEAYKQKELEQKGNYQEMLEMERQKRAELERSLKERDNKLLKSNIFNAVANYAKDAHDVNDLLAQRDYASMIEVDEDSLEPIGESIHKFVDTLKSEKKYLFKGNKIASMADDKPAVNKPVNKSIAQMNENEKKEFLKQALSGLSHN